MKPIKGSSYMLRSAHPLRTGEENETELPDNFRVIANPSKVEFLKGGYNSTKSFEPHSYLGYKDFKLDTVVSGCIHELPDGSTLDLSKINSKAACENLFLNPYQGGVHIVTGQYYDTKPIIFARHLARYAGARAYNEFKSTKVYPFRGAIGTYDFTARWIWVTETYRAIKEAEEQFDIVEGINYINRRELPPMFVLAMATLESSSKVREHYRELINLYSQAQVTTLVLGAGLTPQQVQHDILRMEANSWIYFSDKSKDVEI